MSTEFVIADAIVHVRSFLVRRRGWRRVFVVVLALGVAVTLAVQSHRLDRARRSWGDTRTVWVTDAALEPGDPVRAHRVELPEAAVPAGALDRVEGLVADQRLGPGEVVTALDAVDDLGRLAPTGWRTVAVGAGDATLPVSPGDHVDVVADGELLAPDAVVIDVSSGTTVVAVPAARAAAVAAAVRDQRADLLGRP